MGGFVRRTSRRPVGRPSWAPGGPSAGRQEPRIVGFADSSSEIVGFAQSAGMAQAAGRRRAVAKFPRRQAVTAEFLYRYMMRIPSRIPAR